jgi:hypothetical protein
MNIRQSGSDIPRHWIILDSASSLDVFCVEELVNDIKKSDTPLKVLSRGGITKIDKECTLSGYPIQVWFDSDGVANIVGLRDDKAVMTFQSWAGELWY